MLLPIREIGELLILRFYIAHMRKKLHLGPRPPVSVNFNIFCPATIAGVFSNSSQSFILLTTREIGELVMSQFLYTSYKEKTSFLARGPP